MEIVISVVAKVAEYLVGPAIQEGKYFLCVNKVVRGLEKEKKELISERDDLLNRVKQARERIEVIDEKWLDDVRHLVEEMEDLEQKMKANTSCFQGRFPTWRRYRLCKQMVKKTVAMGKFKGKGKSESNIQPSSHRDPLPGIRYLSSQNFTYFESTKVASNQLMEALQDDCIYMIGVYGMGGCGKTTLVIKVGEMAQELNMFDKVILITVSQTPTIRDIQGKMADMLNFKLEDESEEGRAQRLSLRLKENKRILVIVDDLWEEIDLKHIGICLDNVNKGPWKILVTTRNQSVCTSMDCQKNIHLGLLSEEESWTLFQQRANIDDDFSQSLCGVPRKLCEECKGLPIAIVTVASSLKGKHKAEWEVALDNLRNSGEFDEHDKGVSAALSCLELSYKYLQNKEAELLFLMCSMFPEDYNILIEDLIRYAIGLGVGAGRSSLELKRSLIQAGINKLLDYCLLLHVEDMQCVKMHDLVRDAALWIAKRSENRQILVNVDKPLDTLAEDDNIRKCFAVSLWQSRSNKDPSFSQLHAPNLEMLFLNAPSFDLSGLTCERLHVLSLTSRRAPLLLPPSSQLLKNVRTLRLNGLELGDISFIASLTTLEVLDLRNCCFNQLPDEIGKLGRLKLLDLSSCHIFQNNYNGAIEKCSQLEELYASKYDREYEYLHESIMDIVTLPKLQRFVIETTRKDIEFESTRYLGVGDFNISKLRKSEKNILQVAESVVLRGLHGGYKNIIPDMVGVVGGMNDLANLFLRKCPEIECIFDATSVSKVDNLIPTLVKLHLKKMEKLKELCRGPPSLQVLCFFEKLEILHIKDCMQLHNIFPCECNLKNLKELQVWNCTSGEILFPTSVGQSLQQLESLVICDCNELKHILIASGREHGGFNTSKEIVPALCPSNSHFPMPSLREVFVSNCRKLESIFPICYVEGLARLQGIDIRHSCVLKYVFGECDHEHHSSQQYQNHTMLPHLEVLYLAVLENLVGMCPEYYHAKSPSQSLRKLTVSSCPKLDTSWIAVMTGSDQRQHRLNENLPPKLQALDLGGLPQLNFISCVGPNPEQIWSLQCLKHLKVNDCENLKSLFSMEVCRSLPELMFLSICNCQDMKQIIAANEEPAQLANAEVYFPKLEKAVVRNCKKLKSLFSMEVCRSLPELRSLCIDRCQDMKQIIAANEEPVQPPNAEAYFPKLKQVVVKNCEKLKSLFSMEVCRSLPKLMIIYISCCKELEHIVAANEETEQLPNAGVYFPKLKIVAVKKCNKLKSVFPIAMVRMLPQLSTLCISKAIQLEVVFRYDNGDSTINQTELVLPNLTKIALSYMPSFVDICQGCELQAVKLQQLRIHECPKIAPSLKAIQATLLPYQSRVTQEESSEEEEEEYDEDFRDFLSDISSEAEDQDNVNEDVRSHSSAD